MLKKGLISIADINDFPDCGSSSESSESDDIDDSDQEILKEAQADPIIQAALKEAVQEKLAEKIKVALMKKNKKFKSGQRGQEDEIEYGSDGQEIARKPRKKKVKRKDAQGNDITESDDDSDCQSKVHGRKKKKKKSKHGGGANQEDDSSSQEEIVVNGKVIKKKKKSKPLEGIDYIYETDPVTGAQKKVFIKNSVPNSKGEVFVDDGYVSNYSYKQSDGGTIRRRKKKVRQPGEVATGDSEEEAFEEFNEEIAQAERREARVA